MFLHTKGEPPSRARPFVRVAVGDAQPARRLRAICGALAQEGFCRDLFVYRSTATLILAGRDRRKALSMLGKVKEWEFGRDDLAADLSRHDAARASSEARFRATFECAAVGMAHVAPDGRWLEVNDQLCAITGYTRGELLARRSQDLTHPDDRAAHAEQLRRALAGEATSCKRHKRYIRKDGAVVWVAVSASLVRQPDGSPNFFIGTIEDITKAKDAELALETSNRLLDGLIENLPAMVILKRASDLRLVRMNRAGDEMLGYPRGHFIGKSQYDLLSKEEADLITITDREVLAGGTAETTREKPVRTRDGGTRYLRCSKGVLRDADGTPTHVVGVAVDVTERKE